MQTTTAIIPAHSLTSHLMPSMSHHVRRSVSAAIAVLLLAAKLSSAQTINLPSNDATTGPFGKSATATYGQTFIAPVGFNFLQNFSFWLSNDPANQAVNSSSLKFRAYVMQWDASAGNAVGSALYTSSIQSGPSASSQRYDFASANTLLNGNFQYVAFLSASGLFGSITVAEAKAGVEASLSGTYTGGQFVFTDNGDSFGKLTTDPWDFAGGLPEYQAHFTANFSRAAITAVPEPSSLILLVSGLSALLVMVARKKRV